MFKKYFKKLFLIILFSVTIIFPLSVKAEEEPYFEFIIESETSKSLHGVLHKELIGSIRTGDRVVKQVINYTGANLITNENLFAVSGDNYIPHGFGMGHI